MAIKASATITLVRVNDGVGISSITEYYAVSSSNSTAPSSWSTTVPTMTTTNKYLWNYEKTSYSDGSSKETAKRVIGVYGNTGATGGTGETGKGISSITNYYLVSASSSGITTSTSGWSTTPGTTTTTNKYLWNYEKITYTDNSTANTTPHIIGTHGATGATGAQGEPGIDFSQGKMLFTDPTFASGVNSTSVYNNSSNENVTNTRSEKSTDNPMTDTDYELVIKNTGVSSPGCGGFSWSHDTRANAIFVYRIIAKIPTGRELGFASNATGTPATQKWLTSRVGTGKFTEYLFRLECGSSGTFSTTGYFYISGSVGTPDEPVTWYVAYATCFDMTDVSDVITAQEAADTAQEAADEAASTANSTEARLGEAELTIDSVSETISALVVDADGNSLMTQTGDGWRFDVSFITNALEQAKEDIIGVGSDVTELSVLISSLDSLLDDLSAKTAYILMTTDGSGAPCLELGKAGNDFKVRITNTSVDFMESNERVAYVSNSSLFITTAVIKDELQIGEDDSWIWKKRENGNLGLRWAGGV